MTTLGERLREVMRELEIESDKELATFCGVSSGLVSQWFSGETKLGAKPILAFARTRFNVDWILDGTLPKYSKDRSHLQLVRSEPQTAPPEELAEMIVVYCKSDEVWRRAIKSAVDGARASMSAAAANEPK